MARNKKKAVPLLHPQRKKMQRFNPDIQTGLTAEQARACKANGWENYSMEPPSKTTGEIVRSNVLTYFNLIFLIITILLVMVGSFKDLTFLPIIIANCLIGIIQELHAKKILDNLNVMTAPKAKVVRSGKVKTIPAEHLVRDDIVIFSAGNQIPADAIVMEGSVQVNESLLTGESDEITKEPGDQLMSGSFIVSGTCYARLEKVGPDSYISKLTLEAKASKEGEQSEMTRSLNHIVMFAGICIIPIGIILFYQSFWLTGNSLKDSVTSMVAAVIGMIPEGLYLLTSVTLAAGVVKLSMKKVLVHDMKCIETLARVNVLCVDKTGTITENAMNISDTIRLDGCPENLDLEALISDFASAMSNDNITMASLKDHYTNASGRHVQTKTGFSSAYKYSSVTFDDGAYVLGAPEFVLRDRIDDYKARIDEESSKGLRVLVFGKYEGNPGGKPLTGEFTPYALVVLANKLRKDVEKTFRFFADQGVDIKVISGDNPVTVSQVAIQAGIAHAGYYIDASTLHTQDDIDEAVLKYTVFGRVTPAQKRMFVNALKDAGKTVAMTGDGVNDVLALKDADCSIAMAAGSDAAAQASQLVLLNNDFGSMPEVVMEGRQIVNNMERSGSLFLVKNIFSLLLSVFSIAFSLSYPLKPSQISLISMFTIGLPGFLLSQLPSHDIIKGNFMRNILFRALPAALTDAILVASLVVFGEVFAVSSVDISTACTILVAIVGFIILYHLTQPMSVFKWIIYFICIVGMLIGLLVFRDLFGISGMSMRCVMLFVVFSLLTEPIFRYLNAAINFLEQLYHKIRAKLSRSKTYI
ncbi:MAG: HAD-IC family P-type ATPase [Eubacterium sp.]|nr:HAD-IC family P-type ATPase [Eubacterium sp.]